MQATHQLHMQSPRPLHELRNIERGYELSLCELMLAEPRDTQRVEMLVDDLRRIRAEIEAQLGPLSA